MILSPDFNFWGHGNDEKDKDLSKLFEDPDEKQ